jgi:hypothetical protein
MSWTVHWFHTKSLVFNLEKEDVIFVVLVVTGSLPKLKVIHIWRNNLLISSDSIFSSHKIDECIVDLCSIWEPESTSWRQLMEME